MRIYSGVLEAVKEIERDLVEMGTYNRSRSVQDLQVKDCGTDFDSKELQAYGYQITGFKDVDGIFNFFFNEEESRRCYLYCLQELKERTSFENINPGKAWEYRRDYWERFLHGGIFSYTYSERLHYQLASILNELENNPGSRQGVFTLYDSHQDLENLGGIKRVPCSLYYQILRRWIGGEYKLFLIYSMRSCDYYVHFPLDVWLAINFGQWVAEQFGDTLYSFTHFIGSLHAFHKDYSKRRIF